MTRHNGSDPLLALVRSTLEFYARFDVTPVVDEAIPIFKEEVDEFIEAARDGSNHDHIAEEAADVFVTVIGLCEAVGVDPEKLIEQVYMVVAKNDSKTHETHEYRDGKIRRK
jgi:NTP pyrophosphatase (non-canonical NTP hydrolase)